MNETQRNATRKQDEKNKWIERNNENDTSSYKIKYKYVCGPTGLVLSGSRPHTKYMTIYTYFFALITAFNIVNMRFCMECSFAPKCEHKDAVLMVLLNTQTPANIS